MPGRDWRRSSTNLSIYEKSIPPRSRELRQRGSDKILQRILSLSLSVSQSKDSEFSLARFPKKKRKKAKSSPSTKASDTEVPPKPPGIPIISDSTLSICPSTSDISDAEMDQHSS
ncbi:hypothetical protein HNY73_015633 [Argiope bruennichi]|uniref:Uncharacterized protein n=1 Tax=Argiope bruennichi TaxID=94029 RepID=A0A8T0EY84_ARGBR|nr:hypothetical protein HNY73_015633 [Argiope bruennichi]